MTSHEEHQQVRQPRQHAMKAIDLFAGAGGFSTGATMAGCSVVWAADHWQAAVSIHAANHPGTAHACQDLHQVDWTQVPAHDLLMASPACQGHSKARGKERPHHDAQRSTAWAVVSAAECHRPEFVLVENVPEFAKWALYPAWCSAMGTLGYALSPMVLDAADHGVAQHRRRLFIVGTITTRDRWAVIDGDRMRMLSVDECRKTMGFPDTYRLPGNHMDAMHMLGNAVVPPVARDIINALRNAS